MRTPLSILILAALVIPLIIPATATITDNKFPEARVFVTNVVDGDTVDIAPAVKVAGEYRYRVRLADINAPELDTDAGQWAKGNLTQLLANYGGVVYLDIDDVSGVDDYGRIVAVVYVRYNSTHLLNVNKWLVDNGYAEIVNFNNEFDPNDWSLYEPYPSSSDNYPTVNDYKVTDYNPGYYWNHGGVSYAVTPDGSYVAFAVAEQYDSTNNPSPKVRVMIFNATGGLEANITIDQAYNSATNAFQGFIAIAANNTGFLVVWNQYQDTIGATSYRRIVEWAYIGKTGGVWRVATRGYSFSGEFQYAPMAAYIPSPGNWSVFYVYSTSAGLNMLYVNTHTGGLEVPGYTAGSADLNLTTASSPLAVGVDYYGRLFMDPHSGKIAVVARTWSSNTGYDMGVVVFTPSTPRWSVSVVSIDNRAGVQGPSPVPTGSYYYSALFGNVHSAALDTRSPDTGPSTRILAVYNDTSTSLAYFVYDVTNGQTVKGPTALATGLSSGSSYYPWVIAGRNGWLVIYSDGYGNYNYTYIDKDGNIALSSPVALGGNIGWVRGVFDPVNGRFIIVFSSRGPKSDRDIFLVYVDESSKDLSKYVVPVAATSIDEYFTLPVYLNGRLYLAYISGSTHIAVVEPGFYQPPTPIPEPWITGVVALVVVGTVIAFYRSRRKHSS